MINLGISSSQQRRFHDVLNGTHRSIKVTVQFLDLEHRYISSVSNRLIDGQINIDADAEIKRSATLSILDPNHVVGLDSNSPTDGQAYLDRMVKIVYSVWVSNDWVDVPVFVGPITRVERDEDIIEIEAQGKEHLAQSPVWTSRNYRKGLTRVGVIRAIMAEYSGETRFNFPEWRAKTAEVVSLVPTSQAWSSARKLAKSMKASLFYDGRGVLRLRKLPRRVLWTFKDGDGGCVLTVPSVTYSTDDIINTVEIHGGIPKGAKKKVVAKARIPKSHPLSPHSLGRNGVPRYYVEIIEDETLKSQKAAQEAADRRVKELMIETAEVAFDSMVIPHLEEGDLVAVQVEGVSVSFRLRKMTIALSHNGVSSVGYLKRVSRNTKKIRRK